jgi:predicted RNase H-like HicB family nuclease
MAMRHYRGIAEPAGERWSVSFPVFAGTVSAGEAFAE